MRPLRITLVIIGVFQLVLGLLFTCAPFAAADVFGLEPDAPAWAEWLFVMMGVRFLAFAYGMALAARNPGRHRAWIDAMIVVQAVDWIATLVYLANGDVTLTQVSTAAIMPPLFVTALLWWHPRRACDGAILTRPR